VDPAQVSRFNRPLFDENGLHLPMIGVEVFPIKRGHGEMRRTKRNWRT